MQTCGSGFCQCVRNALGSYSYILVIGCFENQIFFFFGWVRVWVGDWGLPREKDLFGRISVWFDGGDWDRIHWFS